MVKSFEISAKDILQIATPVMVFLIVLFAGYVLRKIVFNRLSRWSKKTKSDIDDIIISSAKTPFILWFVILGIYLALNFSNLPDKAVYYANEIVLVIGLFSVTLVAANIASRSIRLYSAKFEKTIPVVSLTHGIARIVILTVGILIIINRLGISITPILATLGIGGLAVALALQDTLSNLFAGFHIVLNNIVRVGDYVKLESGEEGYVTDVSWRMTKIRMLSNNFILVPNAKLIQTNIINFYYPEKDLAVLVNLGVHYGSDLRQVEKVTCEVAKQVMTEVKGGVPEFEPFIRYNSFGDSAIAFTVILRAKEFVDQYLIKHEFIKRIHERYRKENIVIPYPIRAINLEQEGVKLK
jgi:small-conductance mechanosensitive channel